MGRIYDSKTPGGRDAKTGKPVNDKPCPECGVAGTHGTVRYSEQIPGTKNPTKYRTVTRNCPRR